MRDSTKNGGIPHSFCVRAGLVKSDVSRYGDCVAYSMIGWGGVMAPLPVVEPLPFSGG